MATKVRSHQELGMVNTALGHGFTTGVNWYTYRNKYDASEFISNAVELEVRFCLLTASICIQILDLHFCSSLRFAGRR